MLLYTALLSLLVSRDLLDLVTEQADDEIVFPPERWARAFRSNAQLILHELGEYLGYSPPPLLERLIEDAQKIHQHRPIFQETLATATQPRCESYLKCSIENGRRRSDMVSESPRLLDSGASLRSSLSAQPAAVLASAAVAEQPAPFDPPKRASTLPSRLRCSASPALLAPRARFSRTPPHRVWKHRTAVPHFQ